MGTRAHAGIGALIGVLVLPLALSAQTVTGGERGWIGMEVQTVRRSGDTSEPVITVSSVVEGGPAATAGMRIGDELASLDGRPATWEQLGAWGRTLRAGVPVTVTVRRHGRLAELRLRPEVRPLLLEAPVAGRVAIEIDSVRDAILRGLDSLRIVGFGAAPARVARAGEGNVLVFRSDSLGSVSGSFSADGTGVFRVLRGGRADGTDQVSWSYAFQVPDRVEPFPIGAFLFPSPETETLRNRLQEVRDELLRYQSRERERIGELSAVSRASERPDRSDATLRGIRDRIAELELELTRIQRDLVDASRAALEAQIGHGETSPSPRMARPASEPALAPTGVRFLTPRLLGERFVAGAELTELNDALAEYFGVREGVLVTQVVDGTPAAEAGLRPGDVVQQVGGVAVHTIPELRALLAAAPRGARLTVARKGAVRTVTLP